MSNREDEFTADLLQGTLDLLVLKALSAQPLHGLGVSTRINQITKGTFDVKPGSLLPALHRMVEVGGVEQVKEKVRAGRTGVALETFFQDVRYGLRSLRKKPGFTLTAVIALALGIGANSAIFSVINGVLLRSLAYREPASIVMVWERSLRGGRSQNSVSPANFLEWKKRSSSFEQIAASWDTRANLTSGGEPEEIQVQKVSADFFPVLGVPPELGRSFVRQEETPGTEPVVILGHDLWQSRFAGNRAIVGQSVTMSGKNWTVIGVMPPAFHFL